MPRYLCFIFLLSLYTPLFVRLYCSTWYVSDYTHAYFILPIFLWLVWRKRFAIKKDVVKELKPNENLSSLFIFLFGIFMFIFSWRQSYVFITTLSLVPALYGLVSFLYGQRVTKTLYFPVFYLILLAPLPIGIIDNITLPLRLGVSIATDQILRLFSFPISREGLLLSVGNTELFMAQPCSGFRSIITMFSLALVYVYIVKGGLSKKIILVTSIVPVSIFGNLMRVIVLCLITYYFGEEAGQGFFHNFSGILIFIITILGLVAIEHLIEKNSRNRIVINQNKKNKVW